MNAHQLYLPVLSLILVGSVLATPSLANSCRVSKVHVTKTRHMGCTLTHREARVTHRQTGHETLLSGDELRCGRLKLGNWRDLIAEGRELCQEAGDPELDGFPGDGVFELSERYQVISRRGRYVSVDYLEQGYGGGARGYALVTRRTYDRRRGKERTLAQILGKRDAASILARAQRRFKDLLVDDFEDEIAGYEWDPQAFAWNGHTLQFAMPHSVEVLRGSTLDFDVARHSPLPRKRKPATPQDDAQRAALLCAQ